MIFPPIQISAAPAPSASSSSASLSWIFTPITLNINYSIGAPAPLTGLTCAPPDYSSAPAYAGLTNFRTEINIINAGNWLVFASNNLTEEFENLTNSSFELGLKLANTSSLAVGNYTANIKFDVLATNSAGVTEFIETKYKLVGLTVTQTPLLEVDNTNFSLDTILNTAGTGQFNVNITANTNWSITNITSGLNVSTINGSGNGSVYFSVSSSYVFNTVGVVNFGFKISNPNGDFELVNLVVNVEDVVTNVSINQLAISQAFGVIPPPSGSFTVQTNQNFTITKPIWLHLSATTGSSSTVINWAVPANTPISYQTGTMTVNFGSTSINIPITYYVGNFVELSEMNSGINFTRDNKIITFLRGVDINSFVRLKVYTLVDYFNVSDSELEVDDVVQEIGFPGNNTTFNIGEYVENLFPKWYHPSQLFNGFPNTFAGRILSYLEVGIECEKVGYNGDVIVGPISPDTYHFIRGNVSENYLSINPVGTSVVNGGFVIVHILASNSVAWSWRHYSTVYASGNTAPHTDKQILSFLHKVNTTGRELQFKHGSESINYIVRPEVKELVSVFFRNQHALPEVLNFRGGIVVENDFNYNVKTSYSNFNHRHESLNFDETVTITLSTGGLLPADVPKVIELLKNEIATLYYKGKEFFVNPIKQKVTRFNSSSNINQFSVKLNMSKRDYDSII